jgi:hypothetical protein
MRHDDEEKKLRQLNNLARRLPWIVVGAVLLTVVAVLVQLFLFH